MLHYIMLCYVMLRYVMLHYITMMRTMIEIILQFELNGLWAITNPLMHHTYAAKLVFIVYILFYFQ
jgi:hypothetical protein